MGADAGAAGSGRGLGGDAGRGGSGVVATGRCSAGRSRGPGIGVRECAVGSSTAESGTDSSFPTPWRLAGAEGRENRGASLWFLFHPRSRGMAFAKVCPSKSADPCAPCPSHSTALCCRAVGEVRSGCWRSFSGRVGEVRSAAPGAATWPAGGGPPPRDEEPSSLPAAGWEGRGLEGPRQGSKDHGRASNGPPPGSKACGWAQRRAAGLEGVRLGSKARGRAQGSPGWGHLESSLEGGRSCSAVGPPPAACSSSSSVRLDPREAQ